MLRNTRCITTGTTFFALQNLPLGIQVSQLEKCLSEWGTIVSTRIPATRPGKQFAVAYVQFGSQAAADAVIQESRRGFIEVGNMPISAKQYLPYDQRIQNKNEEFTNLYVKNLPEDVLSDDDLRDIFAHYGAIKSVRLGVCLVGPQVHILMDIRSLYSDAGLVTRPSLWICQL
jgi:RNA recognition motif-containing protein